MTGISLLTLYMCAEIAYESSAAAISLYAKTVRKIYCRKPAFENNWPPTKQCEPTKLLIIQGNYDSGSDFSESQSMECDIIHRKIDSILDYKREIAFANILDPVRSDDKQEATKPPRVLMDGAPGVGKTTLATKVCVDWARGSLFNQYELVLLVPLRQAKYRDVREVKDLFKVGADSCFKEKTIKYVEENEGKNILLIFDGYDELSFKQREEDSLFLDIINGDVLSECTVLVT